MNRSSGRRTPGDLPAEATSFVGRRRELACLADLLTRARLVTLTGPGGVGKTRTAVRAAYELRPTFPAGVRLVELSALSDPELLANTVAAALDLPEQTARPTIEVIADHLAERDLLLLLDTCEHLVDACALLCDALLRAAPGVRIVATSRQPLDVAGEHVLAIEPLSVPDPAAGDAGHDCDALTLFADRASAAVPGFTVSDDNRAEALALCRRLDGIPLAIELTVPRLRVLSPGEMLARLDDRFRLLTGGCRTSVPRHQTLRTAIGWSHDLSTVPERLLWARLSVFAGEVSLAAAEAVCADAVDPVGAEETVLPAEDVLIALIGLVEKSVVVRVETPEGTRYRMLDTVREFGRDQLARSGGEEAARRRHLAYFLEVARSFDEEWTGDAQVPLLRALVRDQADVRAALEYCVASPRLHCQGLRMATALWGYWHVAGLLTEGRYWLRRTLEGCRDETPVRVKALWLSSWYMDLQGERGTNEELLKEAEALAARIDDPVGAAWTLAFQAHRRYFLGHMEGCAADLAEARERMTALGDDTGLLMIGFYGGFMLVLSGDHEQGIAWCDDSLARGAARPGEQWARGWALWVKSVGLWLRGDHEAALACSREGLRSKAVLHDLMGLAHFMEGLAWYAAQLRHFERVAVLQGAADALWRRSAKEARFGIAALHELHTEAAAQARTALGADSYRDAFGKGGLLPLDAVVGLALTVETADAPNASARSSDPGDGLTPRERQVAGLVSAGLTNREVAAELAVSKRTVDSHVEHILTKLALTSRSQIAALREAAAPEAVVPPPRV
ncbi:LuxR C-terminal-related transcriptional regulator [Streptomyces kunmingensis]|uniref:LuxR C-terminal-related transcriptional regulator n=1 Tax=Streptomyces kunmingensis TaxID=68225 RepID=A0ABU6CNL2_9ACTN|nr:LuxR C-terminal-related transcriptional regulator [Streptomyces kunmingensis]MEB3966293.1 LuxR C-terminal-related transcriptional regulator [Streptomyces kunmingensis]